MPSMVSGRGIDISIHTPAKGVTDGQVILIGLDQDFNPHSREGSDRGMAVCAPDRGDFNPHSREGSDSNFA